MRQPSHVPPVVLIHGLGRTSASLKPLARSLADRGHATVCVDYPSRLHDLRTCADRLRDQILEFQHRVGRDVGFVGHSMGGLVARILAADPDISAHAIVMIGQPIEGVKSPTSCIVFASGASCSGRR